MLNAVDYALLLMLLLSMGIGLWRGLVVEVLSLAVWVAAFWLAMALGEPLSVQLTAVESPAARLFLGYAAIFLGTLIGGGIVIWLIDKFLSRTGLSSTDRLLGLCFGLLRGYAIGCVLVLGLGFTPLPRERWWQESQLLPVFVFGAGWLRGFLPDNALDENSLLLES